MDQKEYDTKYKNYPWWSNFLVTIILTYPFIVICFGFSALLYWWVHAGVLILGIAGIWFWDPITEFYKKTVDQFLGLFR
jgi:hypothetical protein